MDPTKPTPEPDELSPEELEEVYDAMWVHKCEDAEAGAKATGNPLFLWSLLHAWEQEALDRRMRTAPAEMSSAEMCAQPLVRRPLPQWAQDWLGILAMRMHDLIRGRDCRDRPDELPDTKEGNRAFLKWMRTPSLTAPQSAALVPLALGLTREEGWNAFAEFDTIISAKSAGEWKEMLTWLDGNGPPLSRGEAHRQVMQEYGFTDDRAFRRFLAKGRKARAEERMPPLEKALRRKAGANPPQED